jgi:hypothetical protein
MGVREIASGVQRGLRAAASKLTPPGNRTPLEESLEQRPGLSEAQLGVGDGYRPPEQTPP